MDFQLIQQQSLDILKSDSFQHDLKELGVWLAITLVLLVAPTLKKNKNLYLTFGEKFSCYWYLVQGAVIHIIMGGLVGVFQAYEPLTIHYKIMDKRFDIHHHIPITIGLIEIVFTGPCCLYLAYLYLNHRNLEREILSVVVATVQIFGTLMFVIPEFWQNFELQCGEETCFTFSNHNLFYFWGCFIFSNLLQVLIPLMEIKKAYNVISGYEKKQKLKSD